MYFSACTESGDELFSEEAALAACKVEMASWISWAFGCGGLEALLNNDGVLELIEAKV